MANGIFRAKPVKNIMDWAYSNGYYSEDSEGDIKWFFRAYETEPDPHFFGFEIKIETLQEFTGFTDKKGNRYFSGCNCSDLVNGFGKNKELEIRQDFSGMWVIKNLKTGRTRPLYAWCEDFEVIE